MSRPSRLIDVNDFAAVYAAAEFAAKFLLWCDTSVTLVWGLMGAETDADVSRLFNSFQKCLRDWLDKRVLPHAWLYAHECSPTVGLHTHFLVYVPDTPSSLRSDFRKWVKGWLARQIGCRAPRAVRVRGPKQETEWIHWLLFSYLVKGFDRSAIVQSARSSPDGQPVLLGDLIAWPWVDPGPVTLKQRVGWSRSLGPDRRALGAPGGMDFLLRKSRIVPDGLVGFKAVHQPSPGQAFQSTFEDGARDVRSLYPLQFYEIITGQRPWSPVPIEPDDESIDDFIATLNI